MENQDKENNASTNTTTKLLIRHKPKNEGTKYDPISRTKQQRQETLKLGRSIVEKLSHKLDRHADINTDINHINGSIYHLLCRPYTFVNAYVKISKNKGALTSGVAQDEEIMKFFGQSDAIKIADKFKTKSYEWHPVRRTMIPKPGKTTKRPIDTPTQENRIVQEAIRGILEAIYEPMFRTFEKDNKGLSTNYGFRPNKSTWDAVKRLKETTQGTTHIIEGDIVSAYNNMDHDIFMSILSKRITDKLFLKVIWDMLKSGIMLKDKHIHSLVGTPQGGIASPLFFNIYMFEFDQYVYNDIILPEISTSCHPQRNKEDRRLSYAHNQLLKKYQSLPFSERNTKEGRDIKKLIRKNIAKKFTIPSQVPSTLPIHYTYARYADDWVLALTGTKEKAIETKEKLSTFIYTHLKMELDPVKTLITRLDEGFDFLGFSVKAWTPKSLKTSFLVRTPKDPTDKIFRYKKRTTSRQVTVYPSLERLHRNLLRNKFCTGQDLVPIAKSGWALLDEYEIVLKFRQTFVGIANYYRFCDNLYPLYRVSYILQYSCAKTLSYRQKTSVSQIFQKYGKDMTIIRTIFKKNDTYERRINFPIFSELRKQLNTKHNIDDKFDPFNIVAYWRTKFKIFACCCICGSDDRIAMHHINSLRSLKAKGQNDRFHYIRSCLNRLQIPVCHSCHVDITNGKYSDRSPVQFYDEFIAKL